jgi:hypothetical protein
MNIHNCASILPLSSEIDKRRPQALCSGASGKDAMKTDCHLSVFCEEPVNVLEVKQ